MSSQQPKRNFQRMSALMLGNKIKSLGHIPRLLAFDGGGVRGLSSLLIVERLMQEIQRIREEEGNPTPDERPPSPWQYFDLICGTSTGGLIAIMLGRLRMVCPPLSAMDALTQCSRPMFASRNISNCLKACSASIKRCWSLSATATVDSVLNPSKKLSKK